MKKYIRREALKEKKQSAAITKKTVLSLVVVLLIVLARLFLFPLLESSLYPKAEKTNFNGVIDMWDISAVTVKGSKYSFQKTICSDFAARYASFRINFTVINELSPEQSISLNFEKGNIPDIIRIEVGEYNVNTANAICDVALSEKLNENYAEYISRSAFADGKLIVAAFADASVIMVNEDILSALKLKLPSSEGRNEFLNLLSEIKAADIKGEYNVMDFPAQKPYTFLPFVLGDSEKFSDFDYLDKVSKYLPAQHAVRTNADCLNDFYSGKTALYCGSLKNLNYLFRRQQNGDGFNFSFLLYPSDKEEFVFISEITSYVFFDSGDSEKNEVLKEFALYMLSDDAMKYTENLGMLNCTKTVLSYENYPHLKMFKNEKCVYHTFRDSEIKNIYAVLANYYVK